MIIREILEALVDWTQNMLTNRNLIVNFGTVSIGEIQPTNACRRILSPLLWCLVVDELLTKLREGFLVFSYADDVVIVARENFLSVLKERMMERMIL